MKPLEDIVTERCSLLEPIATGVNPELSKLPGIRAILFDVYGTLLISGSGDVGTATATDTAEALTQALGDAHFQGDLAQAGERGKCILKAEVQEWHHASRTAGIEHPEVDIAAIWKRVVRRLRSEHLLEPASIDIEPIRQLGMEYECRVNPTWPMPGCRGTTQALKNRGYVLGIVSNAQFYTPLLFSAFFGQTVEKLGFDPDCCIWSFKELEGKPSDQLFPKAGAALLKNHGIALSETLYVGNDMLNDIYTAKKAGCRTALFAGDRRSLRMRDQDERCMNLRPDAVITELKQILEIV
ncbi:MAG: HAD family hydrolase [Pontiellaceae bacterium]|nr:HAD family hydrolase [Pontiellaceae bacterium]MBN2783383.1 HAD family hydrolase [Pontiellaceae bacterium]